MDTYLDHTDAEAGASAAAVQKTGGLASFLLAVAFLVPPWIYLTGDLRAAAGPLAYDLADFLYGPVWAACLVAAVFALRERIDKRAHHRTTLALLAAALAAGAMVAVACIRSSNRYYHLTHPELHLEMSTPVLVVWTTIVAGVTAAGWHFLGWAFLLLGWAGWSTRSLPRMLSVLLVVWGIASLFEYRLPDIEMSLVMLGVVVSTWQGIVLWKTRPGEAQPPGNIAKRESCSRDNR